MKVVLKSGAVAKKDAVSVVLVLKGKVLMGLKAAGIRNAALERSLKDHGIKGVATDGFYHSLSGSKVYVRGLGDTTSLTIESLRQAVGRSLRALSELNQKDIVFRIDSLKDCLPEELLINAVADACILTSYEFNNYKSKKETRFSVKNVAIHTSKKASTELNAALKKGTVIGESINGLRDFILEPSNTLTPTEFAKRVKQLAAEYGLSTEVFGPAKIRALKMGGLLGVAQGSVEEPRFVILKYSAGAKKPHVCLVGKGVTFDTGGLSLKPPKGMEKMKYDMGGGATVIHTLVAAARLKLPVNITALVPLTENSPSATAIKPGDILTTMAGLTVEVLNTDAEGRLILADALHYAKRLKPDVCIDIATLTGAVTVALGEEAFAMMGRDQDVMDDLLEASEATCDRSWQLPLWAEYGDDMKSDIADLRNISKSGKAGTVTAGAFLANFSEGMKWVHFDIAGAGWRDQDKGYLVPGPSGAAVRTLIDWMEGLE